MRRQIMGGVAVATICAAGLALAQRVDQPNRSGAAQSSGVDRAAMDRTIEPCTDFYRFACGGWMATHPIPSDRARWGRFEELQERNDTMLRQILETAAAQRGGPDQKIGDYFATCMDEAAIEAKGATP